MVFSMRVKNCISVQMAAGLEMREKIQKLDLNIFGIKVTLKPRTRGGLNGKGLEPELWGGKKRVNIGRRCSQKGR